MLGFAQRSHRIFISILAPNGYGYSLISKRNIDGAMDVEDGSYKNNTNVHEWSSKFHDAQRFYIQKTVNHKDIGEPIT